MTAPADNRPALAPLELQFDTIPAASFNRYAASTGKTVWFDFSS